MANLSQSQKDALASVGIKGCKTIEEATAKMLETLQMYQVTGVEEESFENLIMYCQAFGGEEEAPSAADEKDAIAREVEQEDDDRAAEDDDDEELLPVVKKTAPAAPKSTAKTSPAPPVKKAAPVVPAKAAPAPPPAKKAAAPVAAKPVVQRGPTPSTSVKFDARNIEEHIEHVAFLHAFFPVEETQYDLLKQGVTLRALMANTRPTVMNFDEVRINPDGTTIGNLYLNKFRSVEELLELLPEGFADDYKIGMFRGETHPSIKGISQEAIINLFNTTMIVDETLKRVGKLDSKMGANRAKMVEQFKSADQKKAPATAVPSKAVPAKKK
jgi:hypothetical protein